MSRKRRVAVTGLRRGAIPWLRWAPGILKKRRGSGFPLPLPAESGGRPAAPDLARYV
ncbi:MAG TPA: hypothetical protein PKH03_01795 [Syntrophales bacterium]|nr:hypothetical protein [Syntrophales bacterium]